MKMVFQAKQIQAILLSPRIRYEYLANKMHIEPDIEKVEGRGRAHLYSFKNVCEFFVADHISSYGLPPRLVKTVLSTLNEHGEKKDKTVFTEEKTDVVIHFFRHLYAVAVCVSSGGKTTWRFTRFGPDRENALTISDEEALTRFSGLTNGTWNDLLAKVESHLEVNFGVLKSDALNRINFFEKHYQPG